MGDYMAGFIFSHKTYYSFFSLKVLLVNMKLTSLLLKIHKYLISVNKMVLICIAVLSTLFMSILVSFVSRFFFDESLTEGFIKFKSYREAFFLGVLLAPFLETLILQAAIIETAKKRMPVFFACLLSALIFGSIHFYNIFYFFYGVLAGLLFAYLYYIGTLNKKGFVITVTAHMLHNFVAFILSLL
jgi:membrane protease YdiL (CAAX protease family)